MGYVSTLGFEIILQAGIYWFLVFGLWISLRVLRYPDLARVTPTFGATTCFHKQVPTPPVTKLLAQIATQQPTGVHLLFGSDASSIAPSARRL